MTTIVGQKQCQCALRRAATSLPSRTCWAHSRTSADACSAGRLDWWTSHSWHTECTIHASCGSERKWSKGSNWTHLVLLWDPTHADCVVCGVSQLRWKTQHQTLGNPRSEEIHTLFWAWSGRTQKKVTEHKLSTNLACGSTQRWQRIPHMRHCDLCEHSVHSQLCAQHFWQREKFCCQIGSCLSCRDDTRCVCCWGIVPDTCEQKPTVPQNEGPRILRSWQ